MIRAFVGVEVGEEVRRSVAQLQTHLKRFSGSAKWVDPASFHLTLVFYGEIPEETVQLLSAALDNVATLVKPFDCCISGVGFFGPAAAPRVLWAGIRDGVDELARLQELLTGESRRIGLVVEDRAFAPHLTVARFRVPRAAACLPPQLKRWQEYEFGRFRVDRIVLFQSRLTPSGAIYSSLHESPFGTT
ncbi:MAG: RNA 2',3'-cyclic phosphodiesterase [Kiritimatiellae bacterium]|nr:RNA 2',3'-cyclic phosphodiesterase [Kiritimatiellia bacterium]